MMFVKRFVRSSGRSTANPLQYFAFLIKRGIDEKSTPEFRRQHFGLSLTMRYGERIEENYLC